MKFFKPGRSENGGFSLIEIMVVVGILTIINIMIFASYPEFSQKLSLKRTSEEVALIVRQAQSYALGIKKSALGSDDYFGFGIRFNKTAPTTIILFTDFGAIPNKIYDVGDGCGSSSTECFQEFKIDTRDYIFELTTVAYDEFGTPVSTPVNILDVVYPRAASMATITADGGIANPSYAKVTIKSPRGGEKYIKIWISGQIEVE